MQRAVAEALNRQGRGRRINSRPRTMKTNLVAPVSHELKTPLASIRVLVDALLRDAQFDTLKTREYLELIAGENLRLTRLIEDFLTFSRIERNRQKFQFAETNPSDVVSAAVRVMRDRVQASACHLRGLKDTFASTGYTVLTAADGEAGLDLAVCKNPDLILARGVHTVGLERTRYLVLSVALLRDGTSTPTVRGVLPHALRPPGIAQRTGSFRASPSDHDERITRPCIS